MHRNVVLSRQREGRKREGRSSLVATPRLLAFFPVSPAAGLCRLLHLPEGDAAVVGHRELLDLLDEDVRDVVLRQEDAGALLVHHPGGLLDQGDSPGGICLRSGAQGEVAELRIVEVPLRLLDGEALGGRVAAEGGAAGAQAAAIAAAPTPSPSPQWVTPAGGRPE